MSAPPPITWEHQRRGGACKPMHSRPCNERDISGREQDAVASCWDGGKAKPCGIEHLCVRKVCILDQRQTWDAPACLFEFVMAEAGHKNGLVDAGRLHGFQQPDNGRPSIKRQKRFERSHARGQASGGDDGTNIHKNPSKRFRSGKIKAVPCRRRPRRQSRPQPRRRKPGTAYCRCSFPAG